MAASMCHTYGRIQAHSAASTSRPSSVAHVSRLIKGQHGTLGRFKTVHKSQQASENAVTVENLCVEFENGTEKRMVLKGTNLTIKRGSLHMLLGPNGCGKSTLLKVLGGLLSPTSGTVKLDQPTGFVFQNPDHQVVMPTVASDVAFGLGRYDMAEADVAAAVSSALELVNMQDFMYRATHTLSGGQRQRVAIAGALAEKPAILLLDELTTFLDVEDQRGVLDAVHLITHRDRTPNASATTSQASPPPPPLSPPAPTSTETASESLAQTEATHAAGTGGGAQNGRKGQRPSLATQPQPKGVTAIWVTHRFEELQYADSATYMDDGRAVFTGSPAEMVAYLRQLGATV